MLRRNQINNQLSSMLKDKVTIWRNGLSKEKNALGQRDIVDEKVCTVWAAVIPQTGSLLSGRTAGTELTKTTHKVVIRYRSDVTKDMWITYKGQRYNIIYPLDPYNNRERLEIFCEVLLS